MRRLNTKMIGLLGIALMISGCEDLPTGPATDEESPASMKTLGVTTTQSVSDASSGDESSEPVILEYSLDELDINCAWDSDEFPNPYDFLHFDEAPRWGICSGTGIQGMAEPVINPMDSRYYKSGRPHTTVAYLEEPVDTLSITTANFRANPATNSDFYSALIAYDEEGNEIDIAENTDDYDSSGRRRSKILTVAGNSGKRIHAVGVSTYQNATYIDNLRVVIDPSLQQQADEIPPEIFYSVEKELLWPVNHKMELAVSDISASDNSGDPVDLAVEVESSEAVDGNGDGHTSPDWEIDTSDNGLSDVWLRAERSGNGEGRVYTVSIRAEDSSGNVSEITLEILVSHNQGK